MTAELEGRVIALVCRGSEADRAIAVALAEAGANLALGTVTRTQDEEFSTASIANEVWAMGREQFNRVIDAADPAEAAEVAERTLVMGGSPLGRGKFVDHPDARGVERLAKVLAHELSCLALLGPAQAGDLKEEG